jgi:ABC-type multidrug transport system ATPase subunit
MTIEAINIGKRFDERWIFRSISFRLENGNIYAITGKNGSGKSTLLKTLAGFITPNEGKLCYRLPHETLSAATILSHISFTSPYMELMEELTVCEMIHFHAAVRRLICSQEDVLSAIQLPAGTQIRHLSSGMKQRLKLALAIFTHSQALFLDEPTANFDAEWESWYVKALRQYQNNRLVVIASNHPIEYESFAKEIICLNQT